MAELLLDAFIVYFIGFLLTSFLPSGSKVRRPVELAYWPLIRLGLSYRWSMYAPEVPVRTRIALTGVVLGDGSFEVVRLPGFDDELGFGKARGLRFIAFQWALCDQITDYLKPALCRRALSVWRTQNPSRRADKARPVAVEVRMYSYASAAPGEREETRLVDVQTVWAEEIRAQP